MNIFTFMLRSQPMREVSPIIQIRRSAYREKPNSCTRFCIIAESTAMEWGDLKFFLATAQTGSTLGAARAMGVNQTTVARRIEALEAALSVSLFHRNRDGYRLTEEGIAMLAQAE